MGFWDWFKDEEEKVEKEETYEVKVICLNCNHIGEVEIKKGIDIKTNLKNFVCSVCGLKHFAPYFFNREVYHEEGYMETYDPLIYINENKIPDETIKFYIKKDGKKEKTKTS